MIKFIVKDVAILSKYGFLTHGSDTFFVSYVRTKSGLVAMSCDSRDKLIRFYSANREVIATVCEMYKNGDVQIVKEEQ